MEAAGFRKTFSLARSAILGNDRTFQALCDAPPTDPKREGICCGLSMVLAARRMMFHDEAAEQRAGAPISGPGFQWGGRTQDIRNANPASGSGWGDDLESFLSEALRAHVLPYTWLDDRGNSCAHRTASHASHGIFGRNRHFHHFDPDMDECRVGADEGEKYLKGRAQAGMDGFTGVRHVCPVDLLRG